MLTSLANALQTPVLADYPFSWAVTTNKLHQVVGFAYSVKRQGQADKELN